MRVQFNLLPDVKQRYINAQRSKRTVTAIAFLVSAVTAAILVIMLSVVYGVNKVQLSSADNSIKNYEQQLNKIPDLNKVLTVQNQLASLASLHQNKPISSRLFDYLTQVTPTQVNMGRLQIDFTANTVQISGTADSQKTVNTFIDTLKFTTYKIDGKDTGKSAFPSVIESSFGLDQKGANYSLNVQFDPVLFISSQNTSLNVPAGLATTRSVLDDPSNVLFNGQTGTPGSTDGQTKPGGQ